MNRPPLPAVHALLGAALLFAATSMIGSPTYGATHSLPGMCGGRTDPNTTVLAVATHPTKAILSVRTDAAGIPSGRLVMGQGRDRIVATEWCRVWQHIPGTPSGGSCEHSDPSDGAVTAHAVGQAVLADGQRATVRVDVRFIDDARLLRVRYRVQGDHDTHDATDGHTTHDDGCGGGWNRIPRDGWASLRQLRITPLLPVNVAPLHPG